MIVEKVRRAMATLREKVAYERAALIIDREIKLHVCGEADDGFGGALCDHCEGLWYTYGPEQGCGERRSLRKLADDIRKLKQEIDNV
jgi:hypothetical protein